jgi:guanylate kinase
MKEASADGATCLLDIDTVGVANIKREHSHLGCLYIFISPPSLSSLGDRLRKRGTENEATIVKRLAKAKSEVECAAVRCSLDQIAIGRPRPRPRKRS